MQSLLTARGCLDACFACIEIVAGEGFLPLLTTTSSTFACIEATTTAARFAPPANKFASVSFWCFAIYRFAPATFKLCYSVQRLSFFSSHRLSPIRISLSVNPIDFAGISHLPPMPSCCFQFLHHTNGPFISLILSGVILHSSERHPRLFANPHPHH